MRAEIAKLHQRLQTTTIYVTHDQTEAMTMASRIVVMKDGLIMQVGTPKEVYDTPNNVFVGGFIGSPAMNFFNGKLEDDGFLLEDKFKIQVPEGKMKSLREQGYINKDIVLGVRPEDIHDEPAFMDASPGTKLKVTIEVAELTGAETMLYSRVGNQDFVSRIDARTIVQPGQAYDLAFDMNKAHFFDATTEDRVIL